MAKVPERAVGTAFGIDPAVGLERDDYLQLLGRAMVRFLRKRQKLSNFNNLDDAARLLRNCSNILVITGAGISTSVGIPDFRSKSGGFYTSLQDKGINEPEEVFDLASFDERPE